MATVTLGRRGLGRSGNSGAALLAVLLLAFLVQAPASPARAAPGHGALGHGALGHDISWPQCPRGDGGYGLPLPPPYTDFVIVGLTRGRAFTENPCLADQVHWLRRNHKPAHGYVMGTYPTPSQVRAHGDDGPWNRSTQRGRLRNVGYAAAGFALASMERLDWRPPVVWIDVEAQPRQPWPTGSVARQLNNRAVIEGLMRGLADEGFTFGLYSYRFGWREIVGDWRLPSVPVWATAGRTHHEAARGRCSQPSFSGGPVWVAQWYDHRRDYDLTCRKVPF